MDSLATKSSIEDSLATKSSLEYGSIDLVVRDGFSSHQIIDKTFYLWFWWSEMDSLATKSSIE